MPLLSHAQVQRVGSVNPLSRGHQPYARAFEFEDVDVQPQFPGGERGMMNFVNQTREYPYYAYQKRITGRVLCSFIITPEGNVTEVRVIKGVEESLNREAVRVISEMPRWTPGQVGNRKVPVRCIIPIHFRL